MIINGSAKVLLEETFDIENPEVSISTVSSAVKILESPDGKCHLTIYGKVENAKDLAEFVEVSSTIRSLSIRVDKRNVGLRGLFSGGSSGFFLTLSLPKSAFLKIKSVSADVEVGSTVRGIEAGTVSGDIAILHNPTGLCNLKTVSGDISTKTFSSCQYSLRSVSGDIKVLVALNLEVDVDGKTVSGDLASEISLNSNLDSQSESLGVVTINTSTVSGDFTLARN